MEKRRNSVVLALVLVFSLLCGACVITDTGASAASYKQKYTKRYKKLEKKCKKKFAYDGPQQTMNRESYEEYKLWDKELNYVYGDIYKRLNSVKQAELKKKEIQWIAKRDRTAESDAADWEGGSGYPMIYNISLITSTKKRIRWLIRNYA